jgi:hypothetical protein
LMAATAAGLPTRSQVNGAMDPKTADEKVGVHITPLKLSRPASGMATPAVYLQKDKNPKATVIWIDPRGKSSLLMGDSISPSARKILDSGAAILAIDAMGTGEWQHQSKLAVDQKFAGFTYGYNWPLLNQRIEDILTAVRSAQLTANRPIYLVGFGEAGPWVLLANSVCGDAVKRCAADANHFNFSSITKTDDPMMLPGALKYGGLDCLASLNAPTPLLIHNAEGSGLGKWLNAAYSAGGHPENLTLKTEKMEPMQMVEWLLK